MADHVIDVVDARDPDTARELLALQRASYRVEADLIEYEGIPPLYEPLEMLMEQPLEWRAIRVDGRIVAAIAVTGEGRHCDIDRLVVHPDWFRHSFGRRLVQSVLNHQVVTVSTGTRNAPARRLYESLGFTVTGTKDIGLGSTATQYERRSTHLRSSFDADAEGYEAARPGYPDALFE
jgi:ribosomal protein S18 acetylase RimI-like enzyme